MFDNIGSTSNTFPAQDHAMPVPMQRDDLITIGATCFCAGMFFSAAFHSNGFELLVVLAGTFFSLLTAVLLVRARLRESSGGA
jgi:hypothetical protein